MSGFGAASRPLRLNFDWQESLLSNPISTLIFQAVMKLLTNPNGGDGNPRPGVMIPIPQYPLYSASLAEYNMDQVSVVLEALEKLLSIFCHFWILGILIFAQNSVCSSRRLWMRKTTTFRQCLVSTLLSGKKVNILSPSQSKLLKAPCFCTFLCSACLCVLSLIYLKRLSIF